MSCTACKSRVFRFESKADDLNGSVFATPSRISEYGQQIDKFYGKYLESTFAGLKLSYTPVACQVKGTDGNKYGPGAKFTTMVTSTVMHSGNQNRGASMQTTQTEHVLTVISNSPGNIVFTQETKLAVANGIAICTPPSKKPYPVTVEFSWDPNTTTEAVKVIASVQSRTMPVWKSVPPALLFCPCFWPHLVICGAICTVCSPCVSVCMDNALNTQGALQTNALVNVLKSQVEGPEQETMEDNMITPLNKAPPSDAGGFCGKCGTAHPVGAGFCQKCGNNLA